MILDWIPSYDFQTIQSNEHPPVEVSALEIESTIA